MPPPKARLGAVAVMVGEDHSVQFSCRVLHVAESTFYADRVRVPSKRAIHHVRLTDLIVAAHTASRGVYGTRRGHAELTMGKGSVAHCSDEMLTRRAGLKGLPGNKRVRSKHQSPTAGDPVER